MLLQSGHHLGADHLYNQSDVTKSNAVTTSSNAITTNTTALGNSTATYLESGEATRHLDLIQDTLKDGWTVHTTNDGRLYYCKWVNFIEIADYKSDTQAIVKNWTNKIIFISFAIILSFEQNRLWKVLNFRFPYWTIYGIDWQWHRTPIYNI